ncbi:putative ABC transport system permease protein [Hypnocyclicus thermotrophus]|uniref:ABC transport system permease protein n=1 Tax=Hypnocyclicus thermotrophus TaxID=1627895 RepID=A0AA46I575_9FUSO|nr:ABC transporter permease [Hypnocyclicus thermotrophus]TDT67410.1 putative ABC transport system permease protein [Hypnocyclicus thermotrophus]
MNIKEGIFSAFNTLRSNKMRSFLTMLGIIIGISSVIMISTIGKGFQEGIVKNLNEISKNNIDIRIEPNPDVQIKRKDMFTEEDIDYLKTINGVDSISLIKDAYVQIDLGEDKKWIQISGGNSDILRISSMKLLYGRNIFEIDNRLKRKVVIIDDLLAKKKFGKVDVIGEKIDFITDGRKETYIIIGVIENIMKKLSETIRDDIFMAVIPYRTLKKYHNIRESGYISIRVKDINEKARVGNEALKLLERVKKNKGIYKISKELSQALESFNKILSLAALFISAVAAISLFVGGIGVMNIMLVSVTERTREIGIRKAIGAKNKDILFQFLVEALILTIVGGILGLLIGYFGAQLIGKFIKIVPILSLNIFIIAISVSSIIGIVFGVVPAIKASKLNPIEALRHE